MNTKTELDFTQLKYAIEEDNGLDASRASNFKYTLQGKTEDNFVNVVVEFTNTALLTKVIVANESMDEVKGTFTFATNLNGDDFSKLDFKDQNMKEQLKDLIADITFSLDGDTDWAREFNYDDFKTKLSSTEVVKALDTESNDKSIKSVIKLLKPFFDKKELSIAINRSMLYTDLFEFIFSAFTGVQERLEEQNLSTSDDISGYNVSDVDKEKMGE